MKLIRLLTIVTLLAASSPRLGAQPTTTTLLDMFRVFGVEPHELAIIQDETPLTALEIESLSKALGILPRVDWQTRQRWQQEAKSWRQLADEIDTRRWQLYPITGRVERIQRWPAPIALSRNGDAPRPLYALDVRHVDGSEAVTLLTRTLPVAWNESRAPENAPIRCLAVLAKFTEKDGIRKPVLLTDQIGWYPSDSDADRGVPEGGALLAQYGFDFNRFSNVVQRGQLTESDRLCFYELLWATRRVPNTTAAARANERPLPIAKLLQSPESYHGALFKLRGTARRAVLIRVTDAEARQRYGIDQYYEVEMFVPLEPSLRLIDAVDQSERVYHRYPVTICCSELPDGFPQGDIIREAIEVDGFFMKLWSYRSQFAAGEERDGQKRQISPLFIARQIRIPPPTPPSNRLPALVLASAVGATVVVAFALRRSYAPGDARFAKWRRKQRQEEPVSFDALNVDTETDAPEHDK